MANIISNMINAATPWLLGLGGILGLALVAGLSYLKRHPETKGPKKEDANHVI
ncbi:MAG: hypothetical protein ACP5QR_16110 [Rhizomicrobium sp.]